MNGGGTGSRIASTKSMCFGDNAYDSRGGVVREVIGEHLLDIDLPLLAHETFQNDLAPTARFMVSISPPRRGMMNDFVRRDDAPRA